MSDMEITPSDVRGRVAVTTLSETDPRGALKLARAIRHPWYRCQALSTVAKVWGSRSQRLDLLEEALTAANEQSEINRIVTVSAWPLGVMTQIASTSALAHLERLVKLSESEPHTLRRADALSMLSLSVKSDPTLLAAVRPSLVTALLCGRGWRIDRLIRTAIQELHGLSPGDTNKLVEHHRDGAKKRALLRSLKEGRGDLNVV